MPIEIKGQQLRIRVRSSKIFKSFMTKDVGRKGRLQIILGYNGEWKIQSYKLNLKDYNKFDRIKKTIKKMKIPRKRKIQALTKADEWWKKKRTKQ